MSRFAVAAIVLALAVPAGAESLSPEETVRRYLQALQDEEFADAYELVSKGMKTDRKTGQVKPKEAWVKESQYIVQFSEAKIFDFQIFPGKVEGDTAFVPTIPTSQDKFLNQLGAEEYELYTLVREDGQWKVDQQQVVVESDELARWFPKSAKPGVAAAPKPAGAP
jgi:hypothetical protein